MTMKASLTCALSLGLAFAGCRDRELDQLIAPEAVQAAERAGAPQPKDNVSSSVKIELGRLLFWDPILSGDRDVACGTCHHPATGYADDHALSFGTGGRTTARNAITVLDAAWNGWTVENPYPDASLAPMFWDNRAKSLENQALGPLTGQAEMRGDHFSEAAILPEIVQRLRAIPEYVTRFEGAFGRAIVQDDVVRAIAAFERTLVTVPSFERYLAGDTSAMNDAQKHGFDVFRRSGCSRCHNGPMLSDFALHKFSRDGDGFRTASLRNVLRTAPYMHDGRAANLEQVFEIYRNVDRRADDAFDDLRVPRDDDRSDVIQFLQAASDGVYDDRVPDAVPSGLRVGGSSR
jgi:cytochrome c peroxidase